MPSRIKLSLAALTAGLAVAALYPALAQKSPESILPPGFGQPEPDAPKPVAPAGGPTDLMPEAASGPVVTPTMDDALNTAEAVDDGLGNDMTAVDPTEMAEEARRSIDRVGLMTPESGGLGADAFGNANGVFLTSVMGRMKAPVASRWASILLRRALLSQTDTPQGVGGADWIAARAWLLVRMGEADNARSLVQRVDPINYTPWLNTVTMQAALATGDPAALCAIAEGAAQTNSEPSWPLARAMCAGLSGEAGTASSLIDQARSMRGVARFDALLAEKVAAVGTNTRRAITIQWDGVDQLTAWRFGLASATGVVIPDTLLATVGPQVRAWQARSPLLAPGARATSADWAAALGVFSNAALVDLYGQIFDDADPADRGGTTAGMLHDAYVGEPSARLAALKSLWGDGGSQSALQHYARLILGARAAAMILPADGAAQSDEIVASMLTAGFDTQASNWAGTVSSGSLGWGLLAVGAPRAPFRVDGSGVGSFRSTAGDGGVLRSQFLFAGLAGLGRLSASDVEQLAKDYGVPVSRQNSWTRALDKAVADRQPGTVALLCAAGMQTASWTRVPAAQLYHIVASLKAVGMEPEARMIAAEALTRS
ncbi:MAG: hypothetical protein JWL66_2314 [Sphingomonadales bacterium]|nr:hypothetical protein [Sphingomonadales bacterium]